MTRTASLFATFLLFTCAAGAQSFLKNQPQRISVAATSSRPSIAPGRGLDLVLEVTPKAGVHVYAPGNPKYIAVTVTTTPVTGVRVATAVFPKGQDLFFAPLAETVKVYSKPFTVRLPVHLDAAAAKGAAWPGPVTIAGTVNYQACDDRVCFPPQAAPFSVRLTVDRQRH